jgi:hypothetical protein
MDAVGAQHERSFDIVVDDERDAVTRAEAPRGAATLDYVDARSVLETPLHHGRAALDRQPCGLQIVH